LDKKKAGAFKVSVRKALDGLLSGNWERQRRVKPDQGFLRSGRKPLLSTC